MRRFLFSIVLFFIPIILALVALEYGVRKIPNDYAYKNHWLEKHISSVQILTLGASHGYYGIQPRCFDAIAFNAGHVSQSLKYDEFILDKFMDEADSLQWLILPVSYHSLLYELENDVEWWRVKKYCIYYHCPYHPWRLKYRSEIVGMKLVEQLVRMKKYLVNHEDEVYSDSLGWGTNHSLKNRKPDWYLNGEKRALYHTCPMDQSLLRENKQIVGAVVERCLAKHVRVLLLNTPVFHSYYDHVNVDQLELMTRCCDSLAAVYENVFYLNLMKDGRFTEDDFFDADHLNEFGAEKLSRILNELLIECD